MKNEFTWKVVDKIPDGIPEKVKELWNDLKKTSPNGPFVEVGKAEYSALGDKFNLYLLARAKMDNKQVNSKIVEGKIYFWITEAASGDKI